MKMLYYTIITILSIFLISCVVAIYRIVEKVEFEAPEVVKISDLPEDNFLVWLGHSSFIVKVEGLTFYTDPVISEKIVIVKRQTQLPIEKEKLIAPDFILISHNHYDHMDIFSLSFLSQKSIVEGKIPYIFVPEKASIYLKDIKANTKEIIWGEQYRVKSAKISSFKVKHFSGRNLFDWNLSKWNAYLVEINNLKIFFGGDTAYIKLPRIEPDVALMPIGAWKPRWFMKRNHISPCEAVIISAEIGAKIMIPMHYGTFKQGLDTPRESIEYMKECAEKYKVRTVIPKIGEIVKIEDLLH